MTKAQGYRSAGVNHISEAFKAIAYAVNAEVSGFHMTAFNGYNRAAMLAGKAIAAYEDAMAWSDHNGDKDDIVNAARLRDYCQACAVAT